MAENEKNGQAARQFAGVFAESFAESLLEEAGIETRIKILDDSNLAPRQDPLIYFKLTLEGGLRGQCYVEFNAPQAASIASKMAGQPLSDFPDPEASDFSDEHSAALEKLIASAMTRVSRAMFGAYSGMKCQVDRAENQALDGMFVAPLAFAEGEQSGTLLMLYIDSELMTALSSRAAHKNVNGAETPRLESVNLKLILDVELNTSLRFGQCQMPLKQVLELGSGAVIELDRTVDEPVELLLDGKVIARGEAVIVDGNYGLRITEIPQPITSNMLR